VSHFEDDHFARASWLTARIESGGAYGTVMNYDGTGMTAGIHQAIAVYPKNLDDDYKENDQGPLWKLLSRLEETWPSVNTNATGAKERSWPLFEDFLYSRGIIIDDSQAKNPKTKQLLSGQEIRDILSGSPDGVFPLAGSKKAAAEQMAVEFHVLFSSSWTFEAQERFGIDGFTKQAIRKLSFCKNPKYSGSPLCEVIYKVPLISKMNLRSLTYETVCFDLAMCVYWSNSVNAPSYAFKLLCKVLDNVGISDPYKFSKALLVSLGTSHYGRWDDDLKDGRYQRIRFYAKLKWPLELFEGPKAIMPKDLPG
jgi:hypothetical protein